MSCKIIDCFMFYNELKMLEYRLSLLYDVVDYFVICEANVKHTGLPKPFFYLENKEKFQRYSDKIIHVMLTDDNTTWIRNPKNDEAWTNEHNHRNGIAIGINDLINQKKIGNNPQDLIIISDLDEIPNPKLLSDLKMNNSLNNKGMANLSMDLYYYNLLTKNNNKWTHAKILQYHYFMNVMNNEPQKIRLTNFKLTIDGGGWHLSYFGDKHFVKNKISSFAHTELNTPEFNDIDEIEKKIKNQEDLYNRNEKFVKIPLNQNNFLPPNWEYFNYLI